MRLETVQGADLRDATRRARAAMGDDLVVVRSSVGRDGERRWVELVVARAADIERLHQLLTPTPAPARRADGFPPVVALVGPTGAGKTTTAVKLALHPEAFGGRRVGVLTLDTFRVGALEQLQTYADIARFPLEVAYEADEVADALGRLAKCDVILVDTPGRSPRDTAGREHAEGLLRAAWPDEVHLVLPATLRAEAAERLREVYGGLVPTHVLVSKVDEAPADGMLAELVARLELPARWLTDGQSVPDDLRPARAHVLAALAGTSQLDRPSLVP